MQRQRDCSRKDASQLVRLFVARSGKGPDRTAEQVMAALVEDVRRKRVTNRDAQLQLFLRDRMVSLQGDNSRRCVERKRFPHELRFPDYL